MGSNTLKEIEEKAGEEQPEKKLLINARTYGEEDGGYRRYLHWGGDGEGRSLHKERHQDKCDCVDGAFQKEQKESQSPEMSLRAEPPICGDYAGCDQEVENESTRRAKKRQGQLDGYLSPVTERRDNEGYAYFVREKKRCDENSAERQSGGDVQVSLGFLGYLFTLPGHAH